MTTESSKYCRNIVFFKFQLPQTIRLFRFQVPDWFPALNWDTLWKLQHCLGRGSTNPALFLYFILNLFCFSFTYSYFIYYLYVWAQRLKTCLVTRRENVAQESGWLTLQLSASSDTDMVPWSQGNVLLSCSYRWTRAELVPDSSQYEYVEECKCGAAC